MDSNRSQEAILLESERKKKKITEQAICKSQQLPRGGKWRREENYHAVCASVKEACFMTADMAGKGALGKKQKSPKCQEKHP